MDCQIYSPSAWDIRLLYFPTSLIILHKIALPKLHRKKHDGKFGISLLFTLWAFRWVNSLATLSYYHPDEHWQSLEVAHVMAFGYGYKSWEWDIGIRSYLHPFPFALMYKCLEWLKLDLSQMFLYGPKLISSFYAGCIDYTTYLLCFRLLGENAANWSIICTTSFWYYWLTSTRFFVNIFECLLTLVALYHWPWIDAPNNGTIGAKGYLSVSLAICSVMLRPTNVGVWLTLGCMELYKGNVKSTILSRRVVVTGIVTTGAVTIFDSFMYGRLVFIPYTFLDFNVIQGISSYWDIYPFYWYFLTWSLYLGPWSLEFLHGIYSCRYMERESLVLAIACIVNITILSLNSHKEIRFLYPIMPIFIIYASNGISHFENLLRYWDKQIRSSEKRFIQFFTFAGTLSLHTFYRHVQGYLLFLNVLIGSILSIYHNASGMNVALALRKENERSPIAHIGSLSGAISFPCFSILHRPIDFRIIHEHPPKKRAELHRYVHIYHQVKNNLPEYLQQAWLRENDISWPSHLVIHSIQLQDIHLMAFLHRNGYYECIYVTDIVLRQREPWKRGYILLCQQQASTPLEYLNSTH